MNAGCVIACTKGIWGHSSGVHALFAGAVPTASDVLAVLLSGAVSTVPECVKIPGEGPRVVPTASGFGGEVQIVPTVCASASEPIHCVDCMIKPENRAKCGCSLKNPIGDKSLLMCPDGSLCSKGDGCTSGHGWICMKNGTRQRVPGYWIASTPEERAYCHPATLPRGCSYAKRGECYRCGYARR